jgi:hypothetical protein
MLFEEMIAVCTENHTRPINTNCKSYWLLKQVEHVFRATIYSFYPVTIWDPVIFRISMPVPGQYLDPKCCFLCCFPAVWDPRMLFSIQWSDYYLRLNKCCFLCFYPGTIWDSEMLFSMLVRGLLCETRAVFTLALPVSGYYLRAIHLGINNSLYVGF